MAARLIPVKTATPPSGITAPPNPITNIVATTIKFRIFPKSTCDFTRTFTPFDAINPYNIIVIPPRTAHGIDNSRACIGPKKPNIIANTAASPVTNADLTPLIATTPVFSP